MKKQVQKGDGHKQRTNGTEKNQKTEPNFAAGNGEPLMHINKKKGWNKPSVKETWNVKD